MVRRIALIVGDTPGHFYPAMAVAEAFREHDADVDIGFFGPPGGVAARLAAHHGCGYQGVSGSALARVGMARRLVAACRTCAGIVQARRALRQLGTKLVIGFGGYASGPAILAARALRLSTAIVEANVFPGLANRLLGRVADRVYLNFPEATKYFPTDRVQVTGWPVREALVSAGLKRRPRRDRACLTHILVLSGSRGGGFMGREIPRLLHHLIATGVRVDVRHQAGDVEPDPIRESYTRAGVNATVTSSIDDVFDAYRWADFAIARGGAGTIAELAVSGLPALLVPLADAADDHQAHNAEAFARAGAGFWARERDLDVGRLAGTIATLLKEPDAWDAASAAARQLARPDAAGRIVDDCERLMRGRW